MPMHHVISRPRLKGSCGTSDHVTFLHQSLPRLKSVMMGFPNQKTMPCATCLISAPLASKPRLRKCLPEKMDLTLTKFNWHVDVSASVLLLQVCFHCPTDKTKIATHERFDEGLLDLPLEQLPPNVNCLLCSNDRQLLGDFQADISANDLSFHICPFSTTFVGTIPEPHNSDNHGVTLRDNLLSKQSNTTAFAPTSSSANLLKNLKATTKSFKVCV